MPKSMPSNVRRVLVAAAAALALAVTAAALLINGHHDTTVAAGQPIAAPPVSAPTSAPAPVPVPVAPTSRAGCEIADKELAVELGFSGQQLVDDTRRVCEGDYAYWPAEATSVEKSILVLRAAGTGELLLIGLGDTSCSSTPSPDAPPIPPRVQQARGCGQ